MIGKVPLIPRYFVDVQRVNLFDRLGLGDPIARPIHRHPTTYRKQRV